MVVRKGKGRTRKRSKTGVFKKLVVAYHEFRLKWAWVFVLLLLVNCGLAFLGYEATKHFALVMLSEHVVSYILKTAVEG